MSHRAKGCQGYAKRIMKAVAKVVQKKRREEKRKEARQGKARRAKAKARQRTK